MATFSVDITDVVFAGARTGYKDITITGMPAGGVTVSLTGDYATYFTYTNNPESKGTNVYRVSTKSTNDSSSGSDRTAGLNIVNKSDSTDYVTVSLKQYCTSSYNGAYVRYVISNYSDIYGHTYSNETDIYFPYSLSDSTAKVELYVDGSISSVTVPSWASYVNETTYTDTGFSRLLISCTNNYDGPRAGNIKFRTSTVGGIYQNGYPSSTSGCTQSISFLKSGGTKTIELKIPASYNVSDINYSTSGDSIDSLSISKISGTRLNYSVTVGNNNTGNDLDLLVKFNGGSGSSSTYLGHTIITQSTEDTPSSTLTVNPTSLTYPASGGAIVLDVTYSGTLTTSEFPSWLTYETVNVDSTHRSYTITASKNSSTSSRSFNLEISNGTDTVTVPITQSGAEAASLTISPTEASVGSGAGTTTVTVTSTGIDTVEYSIAEGWVSFKTQSSNVYTFSYTANTSSSQRSCIITFNGGGLSKSFVINQAAGAISVSPVSNNVDNTSGTVQVTVTGSSNITYSISGSWLTYQSKSGDVYTFAYAENSTSSQRTTTVTFSASGMKDGVFTLTQDAASAPASLTISPTSNSVSSSSGSVQITVTSSGISDVQYSISDSWITYGGKNGNVYTFNYEAKTSTGQRTGTIIFSGGGITKTYTLTQEGASADELTATPSSLNFTKSGGQKSVVLTYTGILHHRTSDGPDWVTKVEYDMGSSPTTYYFTVAENKSEYSRIWNAYFYDDNSSLYVPITQEGTVTPSLRIIPASGTVDKNSGRIGLTVTATGIKSSDINYQISGSWLSYSSISGYTFYFTYTENTSSSRTATITFSAYGETATYTLTQAGTSPDIPKSLKVYPKKLRYYGEGGGIRVSFTNRPEGGIGYEIIYTDGSDWLSVTDSGPDKYVTATKNSGIRRRARIKFYDVNDSKNYAIVPVIQGNIDGYDSIWMDELYYPENRNESGNYYYRLVDKKNNSELFTGISTIPPGWSGNIGGIDIPRLVDGDIHSLLFSGSSSDWSDMYESYITVDIYNMTGSAYPGVLDATFKYCNDWSRFEKRYDYTRSLNDPINGKGCDNMIIPFCVYYDDEATFSIVDTEKNGNVNTYTLSTPSTPFAMRTNIFYDTKKLEYKQDDEVIFSYDMDHCGPGAFIYRNRFGGWDSFLIEGNIIKTDNYTKLNYRTKGEYNQKFSFDTSKYIDEKHTDSVNIDTTYEAYTGWLSDEESERLVFHLLSSPIVYFQNLHKENQVFDTDPLFNLMPIRITTSSAEYKKFRNGKKMVNYLITFEKGNIEKVRN